MKAVFVGELGNPGSSGVQRLWALRQCGVDVVAVDAGAVSPRHGRYLCHVARLMRRPRLTRDAARLEDAIVEACDRHGPRVVWFEWPRTFRPEFFRSLKAADKDRFLISFQDDNPFGDRSGDAWQWREYLKCVGCFDLHLIKRASDAGHLAALGARRTGLWTHGVYAPLYHPPAVERRTLPVSFAGTCLDDRAPFLEYLIAGAGLPVHVFGSRWKSRSDLPRRFPEYFHEPVWAAAYADVLRSSFAAIGFVSHSNHDEWTMRTFEAPGCSTALIAERTPAHAAWFEEGREALFFSSREECAEKIRWALDNPQGCLEMGRAARRKCLESGWLIEQRMGRFLEETFPGEVRAACS